MAFLTVKDHRQLHVPGFKTKCPTINDHKSLFLNNQMPYCFTIILINPGNLVRVCNETAPEIGSTKVRVFFFEVGVLGTSFYEISILVTVVHYQSIQLK